MLVSSSFSRGNNPVVDKVYFVIRLFLSQNRFDPCMGILNKGAGKSMKIDGLFRVEDHFLFWINP